MYRNFNTLPPIKRLGWLLLPLLLFAFLFWLPWHSQAQLAASPALTETAVSVRQNDAHGITFQIDLPPAVVSDELVTVAGLPARLHEPGAPDLPYYATWLAVPPEATVTVSVTENKVSRQQLSHVQAAPQQSSEAVADLPASERAAYESVGIEAVPLLVEGMDEAIYGRNQPYPPHLYTLSEPIYYRDVRLVALHLYPVRYNPVNQTLTQAQQLQVQISFDQARFTDLRPAAPSQNHHESMLAHMLLNYDASRAWRSFPTDWQTIEPALPVGSTSYKIEIDRDGIYEITGQELADLGLDLSSVNPQEMQLMHRGQPVAYQFISDNTASDTLTTTDRLRFFGQAFVGPRLEKQYINDNVYWLVIGEQADLVDTIANEAGQGYAPVYSFRDEVTRAPENVFWGTLTNRWDEFPNEPDAWFWESVSQGAGILTKTYGITLTHPVTTGTDAGFVVELMSREQTNNPTNFNYDVRATLNDYPGYGRHTWKLLRNVNVTGTVPANYLHDGLNDVVVVFATDWTVHGNINPRYFFNRITVQYERRLIAIDDQLHFGSSSAGPQEFRVANFSQPDSNQVLVWDVSNPYMPQQILLADTDISGSGPYTYTIAHDGPDNRRFIATTIDNVRSVARLSAYTATAINPPGGADWIAITHADFRPAAEQLAAHRAHEQFGGLITHVVDIEDIINQYGYGLPLPEAVRNYLTNALLNWDLPPSYVVLVGEGHQNPRNLHSTGYGFWDQDLPNYLLTDLVFKDRFQGLIPSDHTFTTLIGDDLVPDLAIGRIATTSITDTFNVVDKIMQFDLNQLTPEAWQQHYLFVADTTDQGGNFCLANQQTGNSLPGGIEQTHLCRPAATAADTAQIRADMSAAIHDPDHGVILLNYRGHGSVDRWASPAILNTAMTDFWQNNEKPLIILSADCLDGNFAWPGWPALSQTFLALPDVGSAAHWSSTGLGFTFEHSALLQALYEGAFDLGLPALGNAINYSKIQYMLGGYHKSEVYSFTLQGDPAMQLYRPDLRLDKTTAQTVVEPGDTVQFDLTVYNAGLHATTPTVVDTLPTGLTFAGYSATLPVTLSQAGQELTFVAGGHLNWDDQFTITVEATVDPETDGELLNVAHASAPGWDLNPTSRQDSAALISVYTPPVVYTDFLYLPYITR
jgi:uncharacterized repeat protein (TIGR01451 family)